jgi:glutathione reductase (NADPH)
MGYEYDLFTIGAGSGGTRASRIAALAGAKVAVAEEYRIGGTCVIRGCVPKKLLVYGAEFTHHFADAAGYGWHIDAPRFNWPELRDAVQNEVTRLSGIYASNLAKAGVTAIDDRAEIVDAHTVRLVRSNRIVTAERILVATGGRTVRAAGIPGADLTITSNEAFTLERLPQRIAIAGGGYIALEFATIFRGLGVETTVVYRGAQVLRGFDDEVRAHVQTEMARAGIRFKTGAMFAGIERHGGGLRSRLTDGTALDTDCIMFAIGREPYTRGLGLERAGVALDEHGAVRVDAYSQSNVASIYAVGDVTNRVNLTPVAIREGHAFADTVYNARPTAVDHRDIPHAVFCRPSVGVVGMSEADARRAGGDVHVYRTAFRPMKHILAKNEERMLMKLVVDAANDRLLGVHVVGPDAPEMIQLAAIAVKAGLTKVQWDSTVALHPTAAEELVLLRDRVRA